jgi:hypothetical protein
MTDSLALQNVFIQLCAPRFLRKPGFVLLIGAFKHHVKFFFSFILNGFMGSERLGMTDKRGGLEPPLCLI